MSFQPNPGDELFINGAAYTVGQHPAAPGLAYAQAGRQGIVYQLIPLGGGIHGAKALKVFFPRFRIPAMVYQSENMQIYSKSPGLQVCSRDVLTPERNGELIAKHPDLLYSVLMPWIYGLTWFDVIADQRQLERSESLALAKALSGIGSAMEQRGLAHCDLSAPNVMLPFFSEVELPDRTSDVELVDVEQMYSSKMDRPDVLLAGSPGYAAHRIVQSGLWSAYADRFAGAVIIGEMLGWCDLLIVEKAWGESYFDQVEMQTQCERYLILRNSLERNWGSRVTELFTRAWDSQDLSSCPTFGEWLVVLSSVQLPAEAAPEPEEVISQVDPFEIPEETVVIPYAGLSEAERSMLLEGVDDTEITGNTNGDVVNRLFNQARDMEQSGNLKGALEVYRSAYHFVSKGSPMQVEMKAAILGLENQLYPKANQEGSMNKIPFYRSPKWLITAVALLLIGGLGIVAAYQIHAGREQAKQQEAAALQAKAVLARENKLKTEAAKQAEDKRLKEESEHKKKEQERIQQEKERNELKSQYEKQAQYEAYLAQKKKLEQGQAAKLKQLQDQYDKQVKYEAYLAQVKETERKQAERKEAQRKQAAQKASELNAKRSNQVVQLITYYNQAYNAQLGGSKAKAKQYAMQFIKLYESDASYFSKVGRVSSRANGVYKLLANSSYMLPDT